MFRFLNPISSFFSDVTSNYSSVKTTKSYVNTALSTFAFNMTMWNFWILFKSLFCWYNSTTDTSICIYIVRLLDTKSVYRWNHLVKIWRWYLILRNRETIKPFIYITGLEISQSNFDVKWYALAIKVMFYLVISRTRHPKLQEYEMR